MTEKKKILKETLDVCQMHADRMQFAAQKLNAHFPLSVESYSGWSPETITLCDQLIYRFSKLQNTLKGVQKYPCCHPERSEGSQHINNGYY